jgi:hypothetical protein
MYYYKPRKRLLSPVISWREEFFTAGYFVMATPNKCVNLD